MGDLSEHFSRAEVACKDGCSFADIKPMLIYRLELFRAALGLRLGYEVKIGIISGCRCPAHNANVSGAPNSAHLTGEAADIKIFGEDYGGFLRFHMIRAAFDAGFERIGIGKTKFHVDISTTLPKPMLWTYDKG